MIHFVTGLPRAGSTLLQQLLGQNEKNYVTPTSGLVDLFIGCQRTWKQVEPFQAEGLSSIKKRVPDVLGGILSGFFQAELNDGRTCFDKSRSWLGHIEDLRYALGREPKLLCLVRDVRSVLASFERLYRKRDVSYDYLVDNAYYQSQSLVGRCNLMLRDTGPVGMAINRLRDALDRAPGNCLIVPYEYFTAHPKESLNKIHDFLGLEDFEYNFQDVQQITSEDDTVYGLDLHTVAPKVVPATSTPWAGILPDDLATDIATNYADICDMCPQS